MQREKTKFTPKEMAYIALLVVVIAVCSWISIPSVVPFTMQTFGVFCAVGLLGGFRGTVAVLIYILMGLIGLPVFSNFNGGVGYLMGPTGGYIVGFLFTALVYWLLEKLFGKGLLCRILAMALGLIVCYAFGTFWFVEVYSRANGPISVAAALAMCVLPFILPDAVKISLALLITGRLAPVLRIDKGIKNDEKD